MDGPGAHTPASQAQVGEHLPGPPELLMLLVRQTGAAVVVTDPAARVEWVNAAFTHITGFELVEVIGRTPGSVLQGPDTDQAVVAQMRSAIAAQAGFDVEIFNYGKDGRSYWLHLKVDPVFDASGQLTHFVGVQTDITERVESQLRIDSLNQHLALAVTGSGYGVWELDLLHNRLLWDEQMYKLYGHTRQTYDESTDAWRACVHPEDRELVDQRFSELMAGKSVEPFEFRALRASDGALRYVEANGCPQLDRQGRVRRLVGMNRDITERKHAERLARESQERLSGLINSIDGVFWEGDAASFQCSFVSPRAEELLGHPASTWLEPDFWARYIHPEDLAETMRACTVATQALKAHRLEYRMLTADGRSVWVEDFVSIVAEAGKPKLLRGIIVDITARKQLEDRLRQAEKMEVIGQLAGGVAHDFNNTLSAMLLSIELLRTVEPTVEATHALEELEAATRRAAALTSHLLTFARRQSMRTELVELNGTVRALSHMLRRILGAQVSFNLQLHAEPVWVQADASMLEHAIMNLCINARDAMPAGGSLTITTEVLEVPAEDIPKDSQAKAGSFVRLSIGDTGTGMAKEVLSHVFEPFFTTKDVGKGTGLGLASVHGAVLQHHGFIEVQSVVGEGSTFRLFIPCAQEPASPLRTSQVRAPSHGSETVLLVEDEAAVRNLTVRLLERFGYRVLAACDGNHALELWALHREEVDLLLTDIVMPGGMSGYELAAKLRPLAPRLKVLFMTGGRPGSTRQIEADEEAPVLAKPLGGAELAAAIRRSLSNR